MNSDLVGGAGSAVFGRALRHQVSVVRPEKVLRSRSARRFGAFHGRRSPHPPPGRPARNEFIFFFFNPRRPGGCFAVGRAETFRGLRTLVGRKRDFIVDTISRTRFGALAGRAVDLPKQRGLDSRLGKRGRSHLRHGPGSPGEYNPPPTIIRGGFLTAAEDIVACTGHEIPVRPLYSRRGGGRSRHRFLRSSGPSRREAGPAVNRVVVRGDGGQETTLRWNRWSKGLAERRSRPRKRIISAAFARDGCRPCV